MMFEHISDAILEPSIICLEGNLFVCRFESMKVVSAVEAVRRLIKSGIVKPGDTLIDSSSGIYAYALALASRRFGLKCRIIASKTVDQASRTWLELMGVEVEGIPPSETLKLDQKRRVERIHEIIAEEGNVHWMQQYHDDIHYEGYRLVAARLATHFKKTGVDLIGGVGSGCSTGGISRYLHEFGVDHTVLGVQPFGSYTFCSENIYDPDMIIAGIGSAIHFQNVNPSVYNQIHWVSFDYSLSGAIALLKDHCVYAGLSSGAGYLVARWNARKVRARPTVFIAADTGHRYATSVFENHERAISLQNLAPRRVEDPSCLALPWSYCDRSVLPRFTQTGNILIEDER